MSKLEVTEEMIDYRILELEQQLRSKTRLFNHHRDRMRQLEAECDTLRREHTDLTKRRFMRDNAHRIYTDARKFDAQAAACAVRALERL